MTLDVPTFNIKYRANKVVSRRRRTLLSISYTKPAATCRSIHLEILSISFTLKKQHTPYHGASPDLTYVARCPRGTRPLRRLSPEP